MGQLQGASLPFLLLLSMAAVRMGGSTSSSSLLGSLLEEGRKEQVWMLACK